MTGVWVVGSVNLDLVARAATLPRPGETVPGRSLDQGLGGKGANQAVAAARVGAAVHVVGAVGDDDAGAALRERLAAEGLELSALRTSPGPTGTAVVLVDDAGENAIVVVPGANGAVTEADVAGIGVAAGDVVVTQGELPLPATVAALTAARAAGARTVWNPAPADPAAASHLGLADVLVVNEVELATLSGVTEVDDGLVALVALGPPSVVVTLGADGVVAVVDRSHQVRLAARDVAVVDTTGAGDCFVGVLAARLAAGDPLGVALRWANAAASIAVGRPGAAASMPTSAEVASAVAAG